MMTIDVITMGCSKNLVDSERLLRLLADKGYAFRHDPDVPSGDYVVVNTCGFIADAKEESINLLLALGEAKREGRIGKIVVMGCLSERYMDELKELLPEVDLWYGKFDWKNFISSLPDLGEDKSGKPTRKEAVCSSARVITTPAHHAYVKISEGCNRFCAFCAIPLITGRHTSRPIEEIEREVKELASSGVREFNVIAQDLSSYGTDLYGHHALPELIRRLGRIDGVEWIRLHYAYPADFPEEILDVIASEPKVCKYLDIALQHISDRVLTNMRRHFSKEETLSLVRKIRERVPGITLRTTLMVGFPGEKEEDFEELMQFVADARFERMGAFAYSEEEDTWAAKNLEDLIPDDVKADRLNQILDLQEKISSRLNNALVGKRIKIIVDEVGETALTGRSEGDSPDVDQQITVPIDSDSCDKPLPRPGDFIEVEITDALPFELEGKMI